jgi:hypothetical protein
VQILSGAISPLTGGHFTPQQLEANTNLGGAVGALLGSQGTGTWPDNQKPKAFLNWMFLDEQFKLVAQGYDANRVGMRWSLRSTCSWAKIPVGINEK